MMLQGLAWYPQTVTFLEDLREKGIAEILAPVSSQEDDLCFSVVSISQGSSAFMVVTGA
jgi:hypothetical protein